MPCYTSSTDNGCFTSTSSHFSVCYLLVQADMSVDSFLESLGLEKYATAFQVEEVCKIYSTVRLIHAFSSYCFPVFFQVDMDALMHMTDDDLKALLIPLVNSMISSHMICFSHA